MSGQDTRNILHGGFCREDCEGHDQDKVALPSGNSNLAF